MRFRIDRCADITEINPNVIIEFAYAWGYKKPLVFLIADKHNFQQDRYSNISDTVCYQYDPLDEDWPAKAVSELQLAMSLSMLGRELESGSSEK